MDLYPSGCCCFSSVTLFAAKGHLLEGPQAQGRILWPHHTLKAMKTGKGDALRQEQGLFCLLFVAAWTKRMASGGTRPAGFVFLVVGFFLNKGLKENILYKLKGNRLTLCCPHPNNSPHPEF